MQCLLCFPCSPQVVLTDNRDSKTSKWLTAFLDHVLVHRHHEEKTFSHWWEKDGGFVDKFRSAVEAFEVSLTDRICEKVKIFVNKHLELVNGMIDERISRFVLPTGEFNVLGHHIHLEAQEITADMDDDVIKIMTNVILDDDKAI